MLVRGQGARWLCVLALAAVGCKSSDPAPDAGPADAGPAVVEAGVAASDAEVPDLGPADTGIVAGHDAGGFVTCATNCACPQGMGCVEGLCRDLGHPVWCCSKEPCPSGVACLDEDDRPSTCPIVVEPPDAGPRPDAGPARVGSYCENDFDCDPVNDLTCWERNEPPFVWGYCTREGCVGGCPMGSECLTFNDANMTTGCLATCRTDDECQRPDAHCTLIPNASFGGVCLPDCRDDLLDCSPRDGSRYCSPNTGECEVTPTQSPSAQVGDPCNDARQCGSGQTCLTQAGWNLPGGLCTQVCRGLAEAEPCPSGTSCHDFAGIGLCFVDCVGGQCPNRPGAVCGRLATAWSSPACIVQ